MLLSMRRHAVQRQDEQDRRWRNLGAALDRLKAEGYEPTTGQGFLDVFAEYGYMPVVPLSASQKARTMTFPDIMQASGGFEMLEDYPTKGAPDAPAKCDCCRKTGANLRCSWCGEWYCSALCFKKDWKDHRSVCETAADNMHCEMPPTRRPELWPAQHYAATFGLNAPASRSTSGGSSSSSSRSSFAATAPAEQQARRQHQAAMDPVEAMHAEMSLGEMSLGQDPRCSHVPLTRGQKKNAKKKEKKAAARAAAAAGPSCTIEEVPATDGANPTH